MRFAALATDYDGTIAHDGVVDDATVGALRRLRASGRHLIMVTGRELNELLTVFPHCDLFERIVAENGALLYDPRSGTSRQIAPAPPPEFLAALAAKKIPFSVGKSVVATVEPYEHAVLDAIRDLGLEWHVIFNKGSVMALPAGITKATGLTPALQELGISPDRTVGVGDAENDHAFLKMCGLAVAVANALPSVKSEADWVTTGARGAGVTELIDRWLVDDLEALTAHSADTSHPATESP